MRTSSDDLHINARIRVRRHELNLPISYLAESLGVSRQQITNYETGRDRISAGRLFRIAVALGTPIEWFYEGLPVRASSVVALQGERRLWERTGNRKRRSNMTKSVRILSDPVTIDLSDDIDE